MHRESDDEARFSPFFGERLFPLAERCPSAGSRESAQGNTMTERRRDWELAVSPDKKKDSRTGTYFRPAVFMRGRFFFQAISFRPDDKGKFVTWAPPLDRRVDIEMKGPPLIEAVRGRLEWPMGGPPTW
jgi:hypothetical protein